MKPKFVEAMPPKLSNATKTEQSMPLKLSNATNNQIQSLSRRSVGASFSAVLNSASQKIQCMWQRIRKTMEDKFIVTNISQPFSGITYGIVL